MNTSAYLVKKIILPQVHPIQLDGLGQIGDSLRRAIMRISGEHSWQDAIYRNQCHYNAMRVCSIANYYSLPFKVYYVTGEISLGEEKTAYTIHSWNYVPAMDKHFDLTLEAHVDLRSDYMMALCKPVPELVAEGYRLDSGKDIYTQWLNRQ